MTRQNSATPLTVGLYGLIAVGFTIVPVAWAAGSTQSGGTVQGEGGITSPLPGASTGPTTGHGDEGRTGTPHAADPRLSEPDLSQQKNTTPRKSPSSHAEKHPNSDGMDSRHQKPTDKESH